MKKNVFTSPLSILSFVILFCLFSSFITHSTAVGETVKMTQQTLEHNKHNLLKTSVLALGVLGGAALFRRRFRRHQRHRFHGGGIGCLGVLGVIGLVILALVLLPLVLVGLVLAGVAALFGVRVFRRRRYRRF
jgi:CHASE2 domain-containing sensor protein